MVRLSRVRVERPSYCSHRVGWWILVLCLLDGQRWQLKQRPAACESPHRAHPPVRLSSLHSQKCGSCTRSAKTLNMQGAASKRSGPTAGQRHSSSTIARHRRCHRNHGTVDLQATCSSGTFDGAGYSAVLKPSARVVWISVERSSDGAPFCGHRTDKSFRPDRTAASPSPAVRATPLLPPYGLPPRIGPPGECRANSRGRTSVK